FVARRRVEDLRAPAVVEGHEQGDPRVLPRHLFGPLHLLDERGGDALAAADEAHPHALLVELGRLLRDPFGEHRHQPRDLGGRPRPVLGRERVDGQLLDPELGGVAQTGLDRVGPRAVALVDGEAPRARPAAVAVGDDRHVARQLPILSRPARVGRGRPGRRGRLPCRPHQTARISSSLIFRTPSSSPTLPSVSFCSSTSARCSSSEDASPSLFSSRRCCIVSRRTLRIATRPSSARLRTTLTRSLRRSSVSSGTTSRTTLPSFDGVRPTSDSLIAFSIALIDDLSYGWTVSRRASGAEIVESWFNGVIAP